MAQELLVEEQASLNRKIIERNMAILKSSKNQQKNIWDIKKIFFPKIQPPLPVAKKKYAWSNNNQSTGTEKCLP